MLQALHDFAQVTLSSCEKEQINSMYELFRVQDNRYGIFNKG